MDIEKLKSKRPSGMAPAAWNAFLYASQMAGINLEEHPKLRITQTIGNAAASAGVHKRDGYVTVNGLRQPYCAAVDLSVLWLTTAEIKAWLDALAWWGFAAWYRPWITNGVPNHHIHGVFVGLPMKPALQSQVEDFVHGLTGLVGHAVEKFYQASVAQDAYVKRLYLWSNFGGPNPGTPPKTPAPAPAAVVPVFNPYRINLSGNVLPFRCPDIDGTAWVPVRSWFACLGITQVQWHPETSHVWVQGRELAAPVRIIKVDGVNGHPDGLTQGYCPLRPLTEFCGLEVERVDMAKKTIYVGRRANTANPPLASPTTPAPPETTPSA